MIEVAMVFDRDGRSFYWHEPPGRSASRIPDSRKLWDVLWENRRILGGVAHTHVGCGMTQPSTTDSTTFAAIEAGLGKLLTWPISNETGTWFYAWSVGTERYELDYDAFWEFGKKLGWRLNIERLLMKSKGDRYG